MSSHRISMMTMRLHALMFFGKPISQKWPAHPSDRANRNHATIFPRSKPIHFARRTNERTNGPDSRKDHTAPFTARTNSKSRRERTQSRGANELKVRARTNSKSRRERTQSRGANELELWRERTQTRPCRPIFLIRSGSCLLYWWSPWLAIS